MAEIKNSTNIVNEDLNKQFVATQKTKYKGGRKRKSSSTTTSSPATTSCSTVSSPKKRNNVVRKNRQVDVPGQETDNENNCYESVHLVKDMDTEIYRSLLSSQNCMVPVDPEYQAFMMQDFDISRSTLKDFYIILRRRSLKIGSNITVVYSCSCNIARQRLVLSLPTELSDDQESVLEEGLYQRCLHINAGEAILKDFDAHRQQENVHVEEQDTKQDDDNDHDYDQKREKVDIYGISDNSSVVCVRLQDGCTTQYHIVRVDYSGHNAELKCLSCKITNCKHVKAILNQDLNSSDVPPTLLEALNSKSKWRSRYVPISVSWAKIPLSCSPEEQKSNRMKFDHLKNDDFFHLIPSVDGTCSCGNGWEKEQIRDDVNVYTADDILAAKVYFRPCSDKHCDKTKEYDGLDDQLLNMGTYLISHKVLRNYLKQFVTQGTTLSSFYKQWYWEQLESGYLNFGTEFPYQRFRYSWYSFLELLDIQYENAFICPECGDNPEAVVMDGVCLGLRKAFMPWSEYLRKGTKNEVLDGSSHNTRVFINNKETRNLLLKFVKDGLNSKEFTYLYSLIQLYQPSLEHIFKLFLNDEQYKCPPNFQEFLLTLTSNYAVCGLLHFNERLFKILSNFDRNNLSTSDFVLIENEAPFLSKFFSTFNWEIPSFVKPILEELVVKANAPFTTDGHQLQKCNEDCLCRGNGYLPNLKHKCHRGEYVLDDKRPKFDNVCKKKSPVHPSLIPGLFTISCVHGICYGYEFMEDPESPNIPFTVLRTRFYKGILEKKICSPFFMCLH